MPDNTPPPNDDEPTRIGGQPPQRPPMPPQPPQQQPPQQQPPQSPFPQQPYQPAPQQPYTPQGFPQQGPPQAGQNPYGQPPGQYPPGQYPPGPPGYGQQPPQPPPYGPGGPGGPFGPGGPGYGPPKRTGLIVGLILGAAVLLIAAAASVAVITVRNNDDDGETVVKDPEKSASPSPAGSPSESASEEPTASEAGTGEPASESFEAEYGFETGRVCTGMAMSNASPYDPSAPKVAAYNNHPGNEDEFYSVYAGYGKPWEVPYDKFKKTSVVACLAADPASVKPARTCTAKDADDKKFKYTVNTVDYTLTFVEAKTGSQLGAEQKLSGSSSDCPYVVFLEEGDDYYVTPDSDVLETAIDDFVG